MKRSSNKENLLQQREDITSKIERLQFQLSGIEKSIRKIEQSENIEESNSMEE